MPHGNGPVRVAREGGRHCYTFARMQLYEPQRHERLSGADWSEARARAAIEQIVADTQRSFSVDGLWPLHPFDVSPERPPSLKPLYYGAAGVIWALDHLARRGAVGAGHRVSADGEHADANAITPTSTTTPRSTRTWDTRWRRI